MEPDQLLHQIRALAEAYANGHTATAMAHLAENQAERANLQARAEFWNIQVNDGWNKLTAALNTALPPTLYAAPDPALPVATPNDRHIEVRGSLGQRTVSIRATPAQAVAIGAALIACAAALTQHLGGSLADILPPMPAAPPGPPVHAA